MLSLRLLVSSRLLVVKFLGSQKLYMDVHLGRGSVVPLIPTLFKGPLCNVTAVHMFGNIGILIQIICYILYNNIFE